MHSTSIPSAVLEGKRICEASTLKWFVMYKQNKNKEKHTIYGLKTIKKKKSKSEILKDAFFCVGTWSLQQTL